MKSISALAIISIVLLGCGQTGPLYKPKTVAHPPVVQPAPAPAVISTVPQQPNGSPSN